MGRIRGRGKKQAVVEVREDVGSDGEKKVVPVVVQRKRGRPLKSVKEAAVQAVVVVESVVVKENEDDLKNQPEMKRKRSEENNPNSNGDDGIVVVAADEPVRPVGFRQTGSRRKSKPRRSVVGVECN